MKVNAIVNLHDISILLASKTNLSVGDAALFLKELFAVIEDKLFEGESVEIDSLGKFSINHAKGDDGKEIYNLIFSPAYEINELVNKPFANFETTKLNEGVIFDNIDIVEDEYTTFHNTKLEESILYVSETVNEDNITESEEVIDNETVTDDVITSFTEATILELEDASDESASVPIVSEIDAGLVDNAEHIENVEINSEGKSNKPIEIVPPDSYSKRSTRKRRNVLVLATMVGVVIVITASAFFFEKSLFE